MRWLALLAVGMIGLVCCVISLIDMRGQPPFGLEEAEILPGQAGTQAVMPHMMRGWAHAKPKALWWPATP